MKFQRRLRLIIVSTLTLGCALSAPVWASTPTSTPTYVAVIDAGSSGTRLTVFSSRDTDGIRPQVVFESSLKTKGLSSFEGSPDQAGPQAIEPLLVQLTSYIQTAGLTNTDVPIALLGTAGLRAVRETNPAVVDSILISTRTTLEANGFPILANRILPAVQEASLAWLDANALAGTLNQKKNSIGIIEVGGASAQVAFRASKERGRGITRVTVQGTEIPVMAVSYLGLGANMARDDMQQRAGGGAFCFPNNAPGVAPDFYDAQAPLPVKAALADFDMIACRDAYSNTVTAVGSRKSTAAKVAPANLRHVPGFTDSRFIGLGAISFAYADLQIPAQHSSRQTLAARIRSTCSGANAWAKVLALSPKLTSPIADGLCANGTYVDSLVFNQRGIGVPSGKFTGRPQFDGRTPSWPAGYAITTLRP